MTANVAETMQSVLVFDGKKDQIVLTQPIKGISDAITIEFWVNGASNLNATTSIIFGGNGNSRIVNIHFPWGNNVYWDAGDTSTYDRINQGIKSAEYKNTWNHWAFTKNAKTGVMSIYRNGTVWHTSQGKKRSLADMQTFIIGSFASKRYYWAGALAEFRIWNIALEQKQVQTKMHQRLTGKESGLLVYFPLNEGQGVVAEDKSGTGKKNNGNIAGASWSQMSIPIELEPTKTATSKTSKSKSNQVTKEMAKEKKAKEAKEAEKIYIPATGLEDYGRWKATLKDHKRDPKEKPFRRGRIWS